MSLKGTAKQVLALLDAGSYTAENGAHIDIAVDHARSIAESRLYTPESVAELSPGTGSPQVTVTDETTQQAARRLAENNVVLLNFASARNPGGGFVNGAKAQEEDLCRCSGLYPSLVHHWGYYEANRNQTSLLYTDHVIYTPRAVWFRVRGRDGLSPEPFLASVITAPAPNTGPSLRNDPSCGPAIREAYRRRWRNVLAVAVDAGHRSVVLGAWGCGAFGGDPVVAAETAREVLQAGVDVDEVVFAIPARGRQGKHNHSTFTEVLTPG